MSHAVLKRKIMFTQIMYIINCIKMQCLCKLEAGKNLYTFLKMKLSSEKKIWYPSTISMKLLGFASLSVNVCKNIV